MAARTVRRRPVYGVHPAVEHARAIIENLPEKTGKSIVPLYRRHVFAQIKPATRTRIDLGLALKGAKTKPPSRLVDTGGSAQGDRITHRIPLAGVDDIDDQVQRWLRIAYELDG